MFKLSSKIYLVLILIGGVLFGSFLGFTAGKNQGYQLGLEKGRAEIEQKYQKKIEKIYPSLPEPKQVTSISGVIMGIEGKNLNVAQVISSNPFEEPETKEWKVVVTDSTRLVKKIEKTPEEIAKEEEKKEGFVLPFKEEEIKFSDLKPDQRIIIETGEDIKGKTKFEAKEISVLIRAEGF